MLLCRDTSRILITDARGAPRWSGSRPAGKTGWIGSIVIVLLLFGAMGINLLIPRGTSTSSMEPSIGMKRWVIRRKAEVVSAVRGGLLTLEEACGRYRLTVDEFVDWQQLIDRHGLAGLCVTRVQQYRHERAARLESGQLGRPADQQASVEKRRKI
jgi:hypothetical protein